MYVCMYVHGCFLCVLGDPSYRIHVFRRVLGDPCYRIHVLFRVVGDLSYRILVFFRVLGDPSYRIRKCVYVHRSHLAQIHIRLRVADCSH